MFDYDDFYSLTRYASRFVRNPGDVISAYLSQRSTAVAVAALEMKEGNGSFRQSALEELFRRADADEMTTAHEFVLLTGCSCIMEADGEVVADLAIYNDFVAYLTASGVNT